MMELIKFMFSDFFIFCGFIILIGTVLSVPVKIIRCANIRKHGWPPIHLDADGDFKDVEKE